MNKGLKRHYLIILLVFVIFFVISFITNILNSIMADVKSSFNLNLFLSGLLPFSFFIAYGVMSIPAGFLSERYNDQKLLGYSFLLIAIAALLFIVFPGYWVFGFTLFIMGCSMAVLQVIINPLLRAAGGEEHFAFNSVLAQLVFGGASFLSPYLYMYLINDQNPDFLVSTLTSLVPENLPWVSLYLVFAGIALIMWGIIKLVSYPEFEKTEDERSGDKRTYLHLLRNKWSILYFLGIFCYVGTEQGIGNWISQFLFQYHDLGPQTIGANTVSRFWAMLTIGCLLGLILLKILDSRVVLVFSSLATIITLIVALTASTEWSVRAFPMIGFFISVMWSVIFSLGLNSVKEHHGALSGILCTGIAGGAVMPLIVGGLGDLFELKTGMFFLILPLLFI
ncbi:MAG: MFS transporter, partial [Flavobacteriaceae bacterium]|nr:MFS transporter [Flavobacteriaceae bacterium]